MQSDFNKVNFKLDKYKGENVVLKKQNKPLHTYLQGSQGLPTKDAATTTIPLINMLPRCNQISTKSRIKPYTCTVKAHNCKYS